MKLLIVEEHPDLRRLLLTLLDSSGAELCECVEGTQALSLCALEQPDWVVLDLNLARTDGLRLVPQLCRASPQTRVLLMADEDNDWLRVQATQAGAAHLLTKGRLLELPPLLTTGMINSTNLPVAEKGQLP